MSDLEKVEAFFLSQHIMTLATSHNNFPYIASVFYAYDTSSHSFVIASDPKTRHMKEALNNPNIACNIHLQTKEVGKIQGAQIEATIHKNSSEALKKLYFKTFPYALALNPTLWQIQPKRVKFTDNRFGFGKKIVVIL